MMFIAWEPQVTAVTGPNQERVQHITSCRMWNCPFYTFVRIKQTRYKLLISELACDACGSGRSNGKLS